MYIQENLHIDDIVNYIRTEKFVIYGNGFIGKRFYQQVKKMGCVEHIISIAVTDTVKEENINVVSICDVPRELMVFVAAHDENAFEMVNILHNLGFYNYIWIYPYLFELEVGDPIKCNCQIRVCDLLENMRGFYMPAIYYLSMRDYCDENIYNGSLYIKMSTHYTQLETGRKRWERFCRMIDRCIKYGFLQDANVKVDKNYKMIDGIHRLVLAKYFNHDILFCDVYQCDDMFYSTKGIAGRSIYIYENELNKYFSCEEIMMIKRADLELRK